jgi:mannosyltransferase OCH1-like enzyme
MMQAKTIALSLLSCFSLLFSPLTGSALHRERVSSRFENLMGECKEAKIRGPNLPSADRTALKALGRDYEKNIRFLKKEPLNHIPHQMHLIWIGPRPFPEESINNVQSFQKYHPDWTMNFWTDSPDRPTPIPGMVKRLVTEEYFQPIFDLYAQSTNYGEKSDLLRFVIMFKEGGLYFDHDAECVRSLEAFADRFDFIVACERLQYHDGIDSYVAPAIGLFLCRPNHPILQESMVLARKRWNTVPEYPANEAWRSVIYRTFDSFAKASMTLHNTDGNRDIILPLAYFYPNFAFHKSFVRKLQKAGYVYSLHGLKKSWRLYQGQEIKA